jgi:hypothetical protein
MKRPSRETMVSSTKRDAFKADSLKFTAKPPRSRFLVLQALSMKLLRVGLRGARTQRA